MDERNHPNPSPVYPARGNRATMTVVGTVVALLIAGIAVQVFRATPGFTGEEPADEAGTTRVSDAPRYLARVNGQLLTWQDVAQECMDRYAQDVLENVINRTLIQQACADRGIEISAEEVNQEIQRISKRFGLDTPTWYNMIEAERGLTAVQYRRDIIWPMLALKKLAGQKVRISDDMIKREYVDRFGEKVKAKMIMLDNLRRAQTLWEKVHRNPDDFEKYAREESIEPNSRALGGSIPPIRPYSGHEEVRKAAFKLRKEGEVSGIIQIGLNRYVILKYEGRTERIDHDIKDVQAEIHAELVEREVQKLVANTFQKLKEEARIDNYLTGNSQNRIKQVSGTTPDPRTRRQSATSPSQRNSSTARRPQTSPSRKPSTSRKPQTAAPSRR